jgi:hypothetical protein
MKSFVQFLLLIGMLFSMSLNSSVFSQENSEKLWCEYAGGDGPGKGKRIVMIAGDDEYRSEEAMPMLGKILAVQHGFDVTVLFPVNPETKLIQPNYQTNIPGMHRIAGADLVVLGLRFRNLPDEDMKHFVDYLNSGKPIVGFRTSTHAFRYPKDSESRYKHFSWDSTRWPGGFGQQVLGDTWISHHGDHKVESTRGIIEPGKEAHPILRGVSDVWGDTDVYGIKHLKDSADILMRGQVLRGMKPTDPPVAGEKNNPMMPLVWTQLYESESGKKARIVCTTMGAATDFKNEGLRRLLVNSCYWSMGLEAQIPAESNVEIVGDYNPTKYDFDSAKTDLKPSDFDLN